MNNNDKAEVLMEILTIIITKTINYYWRMQVFSAHSNQTYEKSQLLEAHFL